MSERILVHRWQIKELLYESCYELFTNRNIANLVAYELLGKLEDYFDECEKEKKE